MTLAVTDRLLAGGAAGSGSGGGLLLTGSLLGLLYAYVVRFMAVAYSSADASLARITPNQAKPARRGSWLGRWWRRIIAGERN